MAVALEFIDFVVPIAVIQRKYAGGWDQCLRDHERLIGSRVWFDGHLLRDGAMSPLGIELLVDAWFARGFQPKMERNGQLIWSDCCVVEGRSTLPCDWLVIAADGRSAHLKGTRPGDCVGRLKS